MTPLLLTAALAVAAPASDAKEPLCVPTEDCPRVPCSEECWAVHVRYVVNIGPTEARPMLRTRAHVDGGLWGSWAGAACYSVRVMRDGVWIDHPQQEGRLMLVRPIDASPGQVLEVER